jgi:shikimate 5-dehydrogenase
MEQLQKLIGQKVIVRTETDDEGDYDEFQAMVTEVNVDDYYFYEKNETISVTVNVTPIGELPESIKPDEDEDCFSNIPLDRIRKA